MADVFWIGGTGSQSLSATANYSTGALPSNGDNLWFDRGSSNIDTNLSALSAIALAGIYGQPGFLGTIGTNGNSSDAMVLGAGTPLVQINCPSCSRWVMDFGTINHTTTVIATGASADSPLNAFRLRGGNTASKLFVVNGDVGVAVSRPGVTATLAEFDIGAGTLTLAPGTTVPNGTQDGGTLNVNCPMSGTLTNNAGALNTGGSGLIATIVAGGIAVLNNRVASGDSITTLTIQAGASVDFSQNPAPVQIHNIIPMFKGAKLSGFSPSQITLPSAAPLQVRAQGCGISDLTLNLGKQILLTVAAG